MTLPNIIIDIGLCNRLVCGKVLVVIVVVVENEVFLSQLVVHKVDNYQSLLLIGNRALVTDIRTCESVVPRDHYAADLR